MLLNFLGMIYNSSSIFPYDLYRGYADGNIITPETATSGQFYKTSLQL